MKNHIIIKLFILFVLIISNVDRCFSQTAEELEYAEKKIQGIRDSKIETIKEYFASVNLPYPPESIFIRIFKLEQVVELWGSDNENSTYKLVKFFPFTANSGTLGPKRRQGDGQIPEGFYYIERFNPWSSFYLSLGINYPNKSDRILKAGNNPGKDIFIHGSDVTIGCIPIGNDAIKELYLIALDVKTKGQSKIPEHIFPCKMDDENNMNMMQEFTGTDSMLSRFWENLREGYDFFEHQKKLPEFEIDDEGVYIYQNSNNSESPIID